MKRKMNNFEFVNCPLCGSDENGFYLKTPDRFNISVGDFYNIVQCSTCEHVYLNPRPIESTSGQYYEDASYAPHIS
ncbi:MAG: hypothetical protein DWQ10_00245, partial [Calditrichaeota bacterium]